MQSNIVIVIGPGTKELMCLTQLAFNVDILLPAPSWVSYAPQALIAKNKDFELICFEFMQTFLKLKQL